MARLPSATTSAVSTSLSFSSSVMSRSGSTPIMPGAPLFSGEAEGMFSLPAVSSGEGMALSIGEGMGVAVMALGCGEGVAVTPLQAQPASAAATSVNRIIIRIFCFKGFRLLRAYCGPTAPRAYPLKRNIFLCRLCAPPLQNRRAACIIR